jgi:alpha-galactosidase
VVAADAASAVFTIVQTATSAAYPPGRIRMPGLDPARSYRLRVTMRDGADAGQSPLLWADASPVLTGRELAEAGVRPPVQRPQQAMVVELTAEN